MKVVLYEPEIPPNTGNVARLCAAFDLELHLIEPLGFSIDDKHLRRAGLDYWPHVRWRSWPNWKEFRHNNHERPVLATTKGSCPLQHFVFEPGDALVFGPETRGLPDDLLTRYPHQARIPFRPMASGGVRSLNLATACGIVVFTALVQTGMAELLS